jgi:hypothetical protein
MGTHQGPPGGFMRAVQTEQGPRGLQHDLGLGVAFQHGLGQSAGVLGDGAAFAGKPGVEAGGDRGEVLQQHALQQGQRLGPLRRGAA